MKIDLEYNELLDVANALRARAPVFERLGMKVCRQASNIGTARLRTIADKIDWPCCPLFSSRGMT